MTYRSIAALSVMLVAFPATADAAPGDAPQEKWVVTGTVTVKDFGGIPFPPELSLVQLLPHASGSYFAFLGQGGAFSEGAVVDAAGTKTAGFDCDATFPVFDVSVAVSASGRILIPVCDTGSFNGAIFDLTGARVGSIPFAPGGGNASATGNTFFVLSGGLLRGFDDAGNQLFQRQVDCGLGILRAGPIASDRGAFVYCGGEKTTVTEFGTDGEELQTFLADTDLLDDGSSTVRSGGAGRVAQNGGLLRSYHGVALGRITAPTSGQIEVTTIMPDLSVATACADLTSITSSSSSHRACRIERVYGTPGSAAPARNPAPRILQVRSRPATTIVDIDYLVTDEDTPLLECRVLGLRDGVRSLANAQLLQSLIEGTESNEGPGIAQGQVRRLSWNAGADLGAGSGFANVSFIVFADDGRGLLHNVFLTIPADVPNDGDPTLVISRSPVTEDTMLGLWLWLVARRDPAVALVSGEIRGTSGAYANEILASGTTTTALGRQYLFERMLVREATLAEVNRARTGSSPGIQTVPAINSPSGEPSVVNEIGFDMGSGGYWIVPLP